MLTRPKTASFAASPWLRRVAAAAVLITWALLVVGAVVRVTGSGMGCPDWPKCFGRWLPPPTFAAWIEWTHRFLAALVSPLIVATAALAWRERRRSAGRPAAAAAWTPAAAAVLLLVSQILLGAVTVKQANSAPSVVAHLMNALLLLAALVVAWVRSTRARADASILAPGDLLTQTASGSWSPRTRTLALATALTTLVLSLAGSMVQTTGGGFACLSFPLCQGQVWPNALGWPAEVHMAHRFLALACGGLLLWLWADWRAVPTPADADAWSQRSAAAFSQRARALLKAASLLYGLQVIVGIAQVLTNLPPVLRGLHVALAGGLWLTVVALATEIVDGARRPSAHPGDRSSPARLAAGQEAGI